MMCGADLGNASVLFFSGRSSTTPPEIEITGTEYETPPGFGESLTDREDGVRRSDIIAMDYQNLNRIRIVVLRRLSCLVRL